MTRVLEVSSLGPWAAAWDELVDHAPLPTPFLRTWWLEAQPPVSDGGARFVLVVRAGRLLGGQALQTDRLLGIPRLQMLGQGVLSPDHLDLLAAPGEESDVAAALAGWWRARRRTLLDLDGLAEGARLVDVLADVVGAPPQAREAAPFTTTQAFADGYLPTRSSNLRRAVRRAHRDFESEGRALRRVGRHDLDAALSAFGLLHEQRPDRAPLVRRLPVLARAVRAGHERGEARVDVLARPGRSPVAVSISWWYAGRLSTYQVARSLAREHAHAGTVMMVHMLESAVADGAVELDLLRGDSPYKLRLADQRRDLLLVRAGVGALPRAVLGAHAALQRRRSATERERSA